MKEIFKNKMTVIIGILCFIGSACIIGYTYSFFAATVTNNTVIAGEASDLNISLTVTKIAPEGNKDLIPQLDDYIIGAITGREGNCLDDNGNAVCDVYQISLTNLSSSSVHVTGTFELTAEDMPNLKWARISGLNTPQLLSNINTKRTTSLVTNDLYQKNETKNYYVVIWLSEIGIIQTDDGNYTGVVNFESSSANNTITDNFALASYSVDGEATSIMPKGSYTVSPNCTNATVAFDYENYGYEISNVNTSDKINCSPIFTTKSKTYLNYHIKDTLTGTTQGNGQVVNENGYRYEGKNPNNYIKFNNELWRIIGVFDSTSHGQTGEYLTKIIRNDSIGSYAWDGNNVNIWPNSSLYKLLNNYYYTAQDGTESGYCYKYSTITTGNCDWTTGGINDYYRPMVKNVTWYLGGYSSSSATAEAFYGYERSTDDSNYYTDNTNYKTTSGYIGLMYASDYGYSVLSSSCARTTKLGPYNTDACAGNSWLYKDGYVWTITHRTSSASRIFYVGNDGVLYHTSAHDGFASQPVLYLDSSVYILTGNGTKSNPYVIDM